MRNYMSINSGYNNGNSNYNNHAELDNDSDPNTMKVLRTQDVEVQAPTHPHVHGIMHMHHVSHTNW